MYRIYKSSVKTVILDCNGVVEQIPTSAELVLNDHEIIIRTATKKYVIDFYKVSSPYLGTPAELFESLRANYFVDTTDSSNNLALALQVMREQTSLHPTNPEQNIIAKAKSTNEFVVNYPESIPTIIETHETDIALLFAYAGQDIVVKVTKNDVPVGSFPVTTTAKMYLSEITEEARVALSTKAGDTDTYLIEIFGLPIDITIPFQVLANTNAGWGTADLFIKSNFVTTNVTDIIDDVDDLVLDSEIVSTETVSADAADPLVIDSTITYPEVISENLADYNHDILVDFGQELPKDITITVTKNGVAANPIVVEAGTQSVYMSVLLDIVRASIIDSADSEDVYAISIVGMPVGTFAIELTAVINIAELFGTNDIAFVDSTTEAIVTFTLADHTLILDNATLAVASPDPAVFEADTDYPEIIPEVLDDYEHDILIEFDAPLANDLTFTVIRDEVPFAPAVVATGATKVYLSTLLAVTRESIIDYANAADNYALSVLGLAVGEHTLTFKSVVNLADAWGTDDIVLATAPIVITVS